MRRRETRGRQSMVDRQNVFARRSSLSGAERSMRCAGLDIRPVLGADRNRREGAIGARMNPDAFEERATFGNRR